MHFGDEKKEKLQKLERKLYSRNTPDIIDAGRSELKDEKENSRETIGSESVNENGWQDIKKNNFDELAAKMSRVAQTKHSVIKKIFTLSLVFFALALGVAAFVLWGGMNSVSSKNVDIKVVGPLSVGGGEVSSLDINIINNNNTDLDSASLLVEYPKGTRKESDLAEELDRERFDLGKIKSGENYNQNIKAIFFGEKDNVKQVKISLEYRIKNSSALFYKEKVYEMSISSAPVIITPTYPKEVNSNQDISFNIEVASNSKENMSNLLVNVEYPFGFSFNSSSPSPSFNSNVWRFSTLKSGEKKTITLRGNIVGQDNEERVFRINVGTASGDDERVIGVPLGELLESILVKKPFIGLDVSVDGKTGDVAGLGGREVNTEIKIQNNLPSRLFNVSVEASFKGAAFNGLSVVPQNDGFFQSSNNTILWDKRSVSNFADMEPGSESRLSFRLSPRPYSEIAKGITPEIEVSIKVVGERVLESGGVEKVEAIEKRKMKLSTETIVSSKVVRAEGRIENSGPIPPKVNMPTTYTIVWAIQNSFNQVSNVEVRATLPSYVKWTDVKSPTSELVSWNQVTNEVVWTVGSLLPNTGFGSAQRQVLFQLEFLPSSSQIGQNPIILGGASLSGIDKVTGLQVGSKAASVNTSFALDPTFKVGDDKVVQ